MRVLGSVNQRYGRDTLQLAGQGIKRAVADAARNALAAFYDSWGELLRVEA